MQRINAYLRLMRFDKPVGIVLLWFPTAWALWLANDGYPPIMLVLYFAIGTVLMRSAGCVINDIADRNIDKHVQRTQMRPLTQGKISLAEAVIVLSLLLLGALIILLQLPLACFKYALLAVGITFIYPFCKRFIHVPQLVLGLSFSMAIPMAYVASNSAFNKEMFLLCLLTIAWVIAYDTMYAMVDRRDDIRIGVKSTAVLFGQWDCFIIFMLQAFVHLGWLYFAFSKPVAWPFYIFWGVGGVILIYQQCLVNTRIEKSCFKAFLTNVWYGLVMWLALISMR